jgi:hypothetical protein
MNLSVRASLGALRRPRSSHWQYRRLARHMSRIREDGVDARSERILAAAGLPSRGATGTRLFVAARLVRETHDLHPEMLDDPSDDPRLPHQPDTTRAYWAAQAAHDRRERRPS